MRRALACLLVALALSPAAAAQSNPHEVILTLDAFPGAVTPGEKAQTNATIEITCSAAAMVASGQARLQVAFVETPAWATPAAATQVRVDANACEGQRVRVRAPVVLVVAREAPAFVAGAVTARATLTAPTATGKGESEAIVTPRWKGDFDLEVEGPHELAPGTRAIVVVRVTNRGNALTEFTIEPGVVSEGWSIVPPPPREIPAPRLGGAGVIEEMHVTIGSPGQGGAPRGEAHFVVRAVPAIDPTAGEVMKPLVIELKTTPKAVPSPALAAIFAAAVVGALFARRQR